MRSRFWSFSFLFLFPPANPGILPSHRDTLIVAAKAHIGSVAVTDLEGLVLFQRNGERPSYARTRLSSDGIGNAAQAGGAAEPEISIQRSPTVQLVEVITQVALQRGDRTLGLRLGIGNGVKSVVRRVEPDTSIAIENPMPPAARIAQSGFEPPAIDAPVDEVSRVVLAGWSDHGQADAEKSLLFPLHELGHSHCWPALEVDREAHRKVQETRAIDLALGAEHGALEGSHAVRQKTGDVCGASKKTKRMVVADDRYAVGSRCSGNGNRPVEVQAAVKIGPGKRNRVGALRRDDIGTRGQSLRHRQASRTECYANNKARDCFHYQVSTTLASPKKTI